MKRVARIVALVVAAYGLWVGVVFVAQDALLFPGTQRDAPAWSPRERMELWSMQIEGGTVEAIWAPAPYASAENPAPLVVFTHGNGGLVDDCLPLIPAYHRLGLSVLMPEYRGFGRSGGSPSEDAIVADAVAFVDRAASRPDVDADRVIYHGHSLGGGVAAAVARQRPPRALILESTFTTVRDFARDFNAPGFLATSPFDTLDFLPDFAGPVLVIHAVDDGVVPFEMGAALAKAAPNATFERYDAGGHMLPTPQTHDRYWASIRRLVGGLEGTPTR